MVQQEAKLIRVLALGLWLGSPQEDARGLTQHGSVVDHLACLYGQGRAAQYMMRSQVAGAGAGQGQLALTLVVSMPRYLARTRGSWTVSRCVPLTVMAVLPLGIGKGASGSISHCCSPVLESYPGCCGVWGFPYPESLCRCQVLCGQEDPAPFDDKGSGAEEV